MCFEYTAYRMERHIVNLPYVTDIHGEQVLPGDRIVIALSRYRSSILKEVYVRGFTEQSLLMTDYKLNRGGTFDKTHSPLPLRGNTQTMVLEHDAQPPIIVPCDWCGQDDHQEVDYCHQEFATRNGRRGPY